MNGLRSMNRRRRDYEVGTIWVMPESRTEVRDPARPNEKGTMELYGVPTYIIITGPTYVEDLSTSRKPQDLQFDYEIHADALKGDAVIKSNQPTRFPYVLEKNTRICFTWYLGSSLKPLTDEQRPVFRAALFEAAQTLKDRHEKETQEFRDFFDLVKNALK